MPGALLLSTALCVYAAWWLIGLLMLAALSPFGDRGLPDGDLIDFALAQAIHTGVPGLMLWEIRRLRLQLNRAEQTRHASHHDVIWRTR